MPEGRFSTWFRNEFSWTFWSIIAVVGAVWLATLLDFVFGLGWGWDIRGLVAAPLILLIAVIIRFWHVAINKLMKCLSNGK
ncbi:hypothetical protein [Sphingomonas sp. AX6]|uniref:hypothetical protein n=1 Tax=Sphingomonas sp. AX6 TaxID=2653171 RepID=UPI0012F320E3|nr:hypothetical protein [Sphingomonas sp. AX6]VXC89631.1 conserved hypothetical protein [Sphingomonas sp. AX6]